MWVKILSYIYFSFVKRLTLLAFVKSPRQKSYIILPMDTSYGIVSAQLIGVFFLLLHYFTSTACLDGNLFIGAVRDLHCIIVFSIMIGMSLISGLKEYYGSPCDSLRLLSHFVGTANTLIIVLTLSNPKLVGLWILLLKLQFLTISFIGTKRSMEVVPGFHNGIGLISQSFLLMAEVLESNRHQSIYAANYFEYFRMLAMVCSTLNGVRAVYIMASSKLLRMSKESNFVEKNRCVDMLIAIRSFEYADLRCIKVLYALYSLQWAPYLSCAYYGVKYWEDRTAGVLITTALVSIVALLIASLNQGTLLQAQQAIIESNLQARRHIIRHVSHEIRTPLNIIQVGLDMLHKDVSLAMVNSEDNSTLHEIVPLIVDLRRSCDVAVGIMDDLICFEDVNIVCSTLEDRVEVNAKEYLETIISTMNIQCREKNLSMNYIFNDMGPSQIAMITINKSKFTQAVRNVLSNAIKYSNLNGIITVHCVVKNLILHIKVVDFGIGIDSRFVPLISDLLQDVTNSVKIPSSFYSSNNGSMGVGLLAARNIIHNHHGQIDIESRGLGLGTSVCIKVSCVIKAQDEVLSIGVQSTNDRELLVNANSNVAELTPSEEGKIAEIPTNVAIVANVDVKYKFLIVDDAGSSRKIVNRMLTRMGHVCAEADDGDTCLHMMGTDMSAPPYDVILMDNTMPRMSGTNTAKILRDKGFQNIPIIGITDNTSPDVLDAFRSNGADAIVQKPANMEVLLETINKVRLLKDSLGNIENRDKQAALKVLIVDDAGSSRKIVNKLLSNLGHLCEEVDDGDTCLEALLNETNPKYDMIVLDNIMPRLTGSRTVSQIRGKGFDDIPVIGLTGYGFVTEINNFKQCGADAVLKKPLDCKELMQTYREIVRSRKDK